jgi:putative FmdB family regulatory protein
MPIYEYYCETCDYTREIICSYSERDNLPICPDCMLAMRRQISQVGRPQFHGAGFHETDYKDKK